MKTTFENPNFFKSIQNTHRNYITLSLGAGALTVVSLFIGIIKSIKDNNLSFFLIAPNFLLALSATIYIVGSDPRTLLFKNISPQEKNNLKEEELREVCEYISANIIRW